MKLIEFGEQTVVFAKDQPEYMPLPAFQFANDQTGKIACCWELTWRERLRLLFTGKLWHTILTFNQPLQPQMLQLEKPFTNEEMLESKRESCARNFKSDFENKMLKKYGAKVLERERHFDSLNYHPNDRRRCIKFDPEDYATAKDLGILFIGGCQIVNSEYKSAI